MTDNDSNVFYCCFPRFTVTFLWFKVSIVFAEDAVFFNSLHEDNNIVHINEDFALAPVGQGHRIYGSL